MQVAGELNPFPHLRLVLFVCLGSGLAHSYKAATPEAQVDPLS